MDLRTEVSQLQTRLQSAQIANPDPSRELKVEEERQRLTEKIAELTERLIEAEDGKQKVQRQMETTKLELELVANGTQSGQATTCSET